MFEEFPISSVARVDLEGIGYDVSDVSDSTMERLARKLGDDYCDQLFWTSLDIIADSLGIPKTTVKKNEYESTNG